MTRTIGSTTAPETTLTSSSQTKTRSASSNPTPANQCLANGTAKGRDLEASSLAGIATTTRPNKSVTRTSIAPAEPERTTTTRETPGDVIRTMKSRRSGTRTTAQVVTGRAIKALQRSRTYTTPINARVNKAVTRKPAGRHVRTAPKAQVQQEAVLTGRAIVSANRSIAAADIQGPDPDPRRDHQRGAPSIVIAAPGVTRAPKKNRATATERPIADRLQPSQHDPRDHCRHSKWASTHQPI